MEPGSVFTGNAVNYDFLPTFVDWAGGDPDQLKEAGNRKRLHFDERPDVPLLFDLANDRGEVQNITSAHPAEHRRMIVEMMNYFDGAGARIPRRNPNYSPAFYKNSKEYENRVQWGPFAGSRSLEDHEE